MGSEIVERWGLGGGKGRQWVTVMRELRTFDSSRGFCSMIALLILFFFCLGTSGLGNFSKEFTLLECA